MGKLFGAALLSAVLVGGAAMHTGVVVVDVQEADGAHLVVPVPLMMARAGLAFAPDDLKRVKATEFAAYADDAERIVAELRRSPDGTLVEVIDEGDHVSVTKEGDLLHVRALEGDETAVHVIVPLASAEAAVRAYREDGGYFRTSELVAAVGAAPRGDLISVVDGGDRVRIRRLF